MRLWMLELRRRMLPCIVSKRVSGAHSLFSGILHWFDRRECKPVYAGCRLPQSLLNLPIDSPGMTADFQVTGAQAFFTAGVVCFRHRITVHLWSEDGLMIGCLCHALMRI